MMCACRIEMIKDYLFDHDRDFLLHVVVGWLQLEVLSYLLIPESIWMNLRPSKLSNL